MILGLSAALAAAGVYGVAAILQATSARSVERAAALDPRLLLRILRRPAAALALGLMLVGFVLHLVAVRLVPLFLAQAGIAVSLVVTALLAVLRFGERLSRTEWIAIGGVIAGLALLSGSAGAVGDRRPEGMAYLLLGGAAVLGVLGSLVVTYGRGGLTSAVLGLLAGCGYAIVGVSARLLPGFRPDQLAFSPASYSLATAGLLAFLLYSIALQRGAVTLATTPMIVTQTVVPALVGVWLLGDGVRPGWAPAALAGFAVTVVAAGALVRFEGGPHPQPDGAAEEPPLPARSGVDPTG